jgi:co-chaperonin GroES (HSP10)
MSVTTAELLRTRMRNDTLLVLLDADATHGTEVEEQNTIIAPDAYQYHSCRGEVLIIGPGIRRWSKRLKREVLIPCELVVGDRVEIAPDIGQGIYAADGRELRLCRESDLRLRVN